MLILCLLCAFDCVGCIFIEGQFTKLSNSAVEAIDERRRVGARRGVARGLTGRRSDDKAQDEDRRILCNQFN
jgi:hypothetical protein